jgi:hypothetical protein
MAERWYNGAPIRVRNWLVEHLISRAEEDSSSDGIDRIENVEVVIKRIRTPFIHPERSRRKGKGKGGELINWR